MADTANGGSVGEVMTGHDGENDFKGVEGGKVTGGVEGGGSKGGGKGDRRGVFKGFEREKVEGGFEGGGSLGGDKEIEARTQMQARSALWPALKCIGGECSALVAT